MGFSIKSRLGSAPTLLNASRTTNFTYLVKGLQANDVKIINNVNTRSKLKDRIKKIYDLGGWLEFETMDNPKFKKNLMMVDSVMPQIASRILFAYFSSNKNSMTDLLTHLINENYFDREASFYEHKIKELLSAIALGMKPGTTWDGNEEATGGYIIVKSSGDVLTYYIYNRDSFKKYLLNNTRLDSGSSSKHNYGTVYSDNDIHRIKLNLQIRFNDN